MNYVPQNIVGNKFIAMRDSTAGINYISYLTDLFGYILIFF